MGNLWSQPFYLDGLQFPSPIPRNAHAKPSSEKVEQLLRASINSYRLSAIAAPLTAAYYLGADPKTLTKLYEKWVPELCTVWPEDDPVADSIGKFNLSEFYGDDRYEQRYYEYFRDCLTEETNWDSVISKHMDQLWARLVRNEMRPMIELAAGIEMDNGMIVSEALAMACTDPAGPIAIVNADESSSTEKPAVDNRSLAIVFRDLARQALKLRSYTAVVGAHACAEVFLHSGINLLSEQRERDILDAMSRFMSSNHHHATIPHVSAEEALKSEDALLITYTRSRLVLEYFAV